MKKYLVVFYVKGRKMQDEIFANSPNQAQIFCKQRHIGSSSVSAYLVK